MDFDLHSCSFCLMINFSLTFVHQEWSLYRCLLRKMVNRFGFAKARSVRTGETLQQVKISGPSAGGRKEASPSAATFPDALHSHHTGSLLFFKPTTHAPFWTLHSVSSAWNALPLFIPPRGSLPHFPQSHFHQVSAEEPLSQGPPELPQDQPLPLCLPCCILLCIYCFPAFICSPSG